MSDQRAGQSATDYSYGYDVLGSVSQLIDDSGQAKASYGYSAYGDADSELTHEQDPYGSNGAQTQANEPLNSFRYEGRRLDLGSERADLGSGASSGGYDMGARRFAPDTADFLQQDGYTHALSDLGLATDPLTGNRYALAGLGPTGPRPTFIELGPAVAPSALVTTLAAIPTTLDRRQTRSRCGGYRVAPDLEARHS
jgi:hypothetical protein